MLLKMLRFPLKHHNEETTLLSQRYSAQDINLNSHCHDKSHTFSRTDRASFAKQKLSDHAFSTETSATDSWVSCFPDNQCRDCRERDVADVSRCFVVAVGLVMQPNNTVFT